MLFNLGTPLNKFSFLDRHDKRRGFASSWAWLPNAVPTRLPLSTLRDHAGVLEQRPHVSPHLRDPPVEAGWLFHDVRFWVQGRDGLLNEWMSSSGALCPPLAILLQQQHRLFNIQKWNLLPKAVVELVESRKLEWCFYTIIVSNFAKTHKLYSGCYYYNSMPQLQPFLYIPYQTQASSTSVFFYTQNIIFVFF